MNNDSNKIWKTRVPSQLAAILSDIRDENTMRNFLRDVMTEKEIIEIAARLEAAKMLSKGASYKEVARETKLSSRTIARVSEWLQNGSAGYQAAIGLINNEK